MLGKKLKRGDTIGLVAPAGIEDTEKIQKGIMCLNNIGFNVKEGKGIYNKWGYFAGTDEERAQDIMDMFEDDNVNMILCVRGGYGAMRIMSYLDFKKIRKKPKVFMGYSDITILLNTLYERTGMITFHGPMLNSNLGDRYTFMSFIKTLTEGDKKYELKNPPNLPLTANSNKSVEGRLVGGNLSLICSTLATPYEIRTKDNILFIEEIGEPPYKVDRLLTQLILAGKLQQCSGIILGQFTDCENNDKGFSLKEIIEDRILALKKPTLINFASGHDNPKLTLPIGARVRLNCERRTLEVLQPVVK